MGQVTVEIGGRAYPLSCRDGDEAHLASLAAGIATKAEGLTRSLGSMSEARLLLMAALMVADELHELRSGDKPATLMPSTSDLVPAVDAAAEKRLDDLMARAERLAEKLA